MLFNSYSYEILYEQFYWIYLQGDIKLLLVTVNNRLIFEIEIVHDLSCHSILYLLLNSCDGNDAFWILMSLCIREIIQLLQQEHRTLSLQICVHQTVRLTTEFVDWATCVHCTNTCLRYQPLWPATWSSASLTHGQACHKTSLMKQLVIEESGYVQTWGKRTSLWTSAKLKPALFGANTLHNWLLSEPPTVYRGKCVISHYFCRSYLKANEVSKSEGTREVKYAYHLWTCADAVDQKLSKLVHACRSYSQRCILLRRSVEENECFESHLYSFVKRFIFVYFEW